MKYTDKMLEEAVKNSTSFAGVARYVHASSSNSVREHLRNRIIKLKLDYSHFSRKNCGKGKIAKNKISATLLLVNKKLSKRIPTYQLKRALLEINRQYICERCNISTWYNEKLILQIHHKDGNWSNNTKENLIFVCPNCHSQLDYKLKNE